MSKREEINLFGREANFVPLEEYKEQVRRKRPKQHEKKFMDSVMEVASSLDLPCIHIEYYCGNRFFPTCSGSRKAPHAETRLACPVCGEEKIATCVNRLNRGLAGHFDILGISWAIETKHKINVGRQEAKGAGSQPLRQSLYEVTNIPQLVANEADSQKIYEFLVARHNEKFNKT